MTTPSKFTKQYLFAEEKGTAWRLPSNSLSFYKLLLENADENSFNFSCYAVLNNLVRSYEWLPVSFKVVSLITCTVSQKNTQ